MKASKVNARIASRLRDLLADFRRVTGTPFQHFFCPVLYRDEADVELCQGHIVNQAFRISKAWAVQRKDVDGFFGRNFESDFVALKDKGRSIDEVMADPTLSKRYRPTIQVGERPVDYYYPKGQIPPDHCRMILDGPAGRTHLALKMPPAEMTSKQGARLHVEYQKDIRIPALVSLLKAAHLTLFRMVGYGYALSAGGRFLGYDVLGSFFLANESRTKDGVLANAFPYFRDVAHMVRPVMGEAADKLDGTIDNHTVFICEKGALRWGMIVLVRTALHAVHAVLVPLLESPRAREAFVEFLQGSADEEITSRPAQFKGDHWEAAVGTGTHVWPKTGLLYPEEPGSSSVA